MCLMVVPLDVPIHLKPIQLVQIGKRNRENHHSNKRREEKEQQMAEKEKEHEHHQHIYTHSDIYILATATSIVYLTTLFRHIYDRTGIGVDKAALTKIIHSCYVRG